MKYFTLVLLFWISDLSLVLNTPKGKKLLTNYYEKSVSQEGESNAIITPEVKASFDKELSTPNVKLLLHGNEEFFTWDSQISYSIDVSDLVDGESKYGEINANEVILEIEYLSTANQNQINEKIKISEGRTEHIGLALMKKSTCFNCHADKSIHTGPSFFQIAQRYEKTPRNIKSLAGHILGGSVDIWGDRVMPAHPQFTDEETKQIADYILTQGKRKHNWILAGLEGTFRTIEKPVNFEEGSYILTASYISKSKKKGQHSLVLQVR